ncbi:uncharacterized protein [Coffea arabica]|uniref:Leucine-rich repeat-containing N-terminal plant-type domain-containing protein n=1 Tax=Coffea arabica TaxID=13443 RepID=A0A6P6SWB7_COFAR|nr:leucine-rich repeat receptor-like serine/threonine-protein kinase BAM1 [Coffea arabica]
MHKTSRSFLFLLLVLFLLHSLSKIQGLPQQNSISPIDLSALQQIENSLTDVPSSRAPPSARFFTSWDFSSHDPCSTFAGITCSSPFLNPRRVTSLILGTGLSGSLGLAGSLSPSISNLTELNQLVLNPGIVTGPIPAQLGSLRNLRVISLTNNRLTGSIPLSIYALPNLHTLDLSNNQLWGSIPPGISHLDQLKVLVLASNRLSGEIPNELPTQLLHLDLKNNFFSGTLPARMPLSIRYLSASGNSMWGPLNRLESLSELVYLDISMNRFSGTIPPSLFRSSLSSMLLQRNNLSGGVPQQKNTTTPLSSSSSSSSSLKLDFYGEGSIVDLSHNMLTGELPAGAFSGVETLFLNNNRFTGKVPKEYVESLYSGGTKTLYLQHNYLTDFPIISDLKLPDSVSVCLSYNCMVPPVGLTACPASAGEQLSRPAYQCSKFNNGGSTG